MWGNSFGPNVWGWLEFGGWSSSFEKRNLCHNFIWGKRVVFDFVFDWSLQIGRRIELDEEGNMAAKGFQDPKGDCVQFLCLFELIHYVIKQWFLADIVSWLNKLRIKHIFTWLIFFFFFLTRKSLWNKTLIDKKIHRNKNGTKMQQTNSKIGTNMLRKRSKYLTEMKKFR